ncbi:MAG: type II toxin-antitoxin system HicA family toxin [Acidimicrobiales bacterium]
MADELPACSSVQVVTALKRLGFEQRNKSRGSHQAFSRQVGNDKHTTVVPLGKSRIPTGTLKNILKLAHVTVDEFIGARR